jgi:NifU-like protein involved in Fe-S cluster formation
MSAALYTRDILRLAVSIPHQGRLEKPEASAEVRSKTCGSRVTADMVLDGEIIENLGLEVNACALGQASAAILGASAIGKSKEDIVAVRHGLLQFFAGEKLSPGLWEDMEHLAAAKDHKGRHAAIILPYDALIAAFEIALTNNEVA